MRKAIHTTEAVAPLVYRKPSARAHAAQMFRMFPPQPPIVQDEETDRAYTQYIADGLADTDGYFGPISREAFYATHRPTN
jgi:hypothetical protein